MSQEDIQTDGKGWLVAREQARGYERAKQKLDDLGVPDTAIKGMYHAAVAERIDWLAHDLMGSPDDPYRARTRHTIAAGQ